MVLDTQVHSLATRIRDEFNELRNVDLPLKAPLVHSHVIGDVTGLQTALDGKAAASHTHIIGNITGLQAALDAKAASTHTHTLDSLSNTTITSVASGHVIRYNGTAWVNVALAAGDVGAAPAAHTHVKANITDFAHTHLIGDLPASVFNDSTHLPTWAEVTGKPATFPPAVHGHALTDANITGILPIAQVPTGTTGTTVALGNHLHTGVYAPVSHTHVIGDLPATVFSTTHLPDWTEVAGKPTTFTPSAHTHTLLDLPDAWIKRAVRVATTANITLSGTQTIDGIAVVAGDRVLVKNQTSTQTNGIYQVNAGAWTRTTGADSATDIAGATVSIDQGTQGGQIWTTTFKTTDTLGTTAMLWYKVVDSSQVGVAGGVQAYTALPANIFHTGHLPTWAEISGAPASFPPSAHTHTKANITDFAHTHPFAELTGVAAAVHGHALTDANITGIIPDAQLPGRLYSHSGSNVIANANSAMTYGQYGLDPTSLNAPSGSTYWTLLVDGYNGAWVHQLARHIDPGTTGVSIAYERWWLNGTWTSWFKILSTQADLDARYALIGSAPAAHTHAYSSLTGIPSTFTPSAHTHTKANITDFAHTHLIADLPASVFNDSTHLPTWAEISGKPTTFTPAAHSHLIADLPATIFHTGHLPLTSEVTGLDTALAGKASLASPVFTGTIGAGGINTNTSMSSFQLNTVAADQGGLEVRNDTGFPAIGFHKGSAFRPYIRAVSGTEFQAVNQGHNTYVNFRALGFYADGGGLYDNGNRAYSASNPPPAAIPAAHTHVKANITDFAHTHPFAELTGVAAASHTHDVNALTGVIDAAHLPTRLAPGNVANTTSTPNNAVTTGSWYIASLSGALPPGFVGPDFHVYVNAYSPQFVSQIAFDFYSNRTAQRFTANGSTWSAWSTIVDKAYGDTIYAPNSHTHLWSHITDKPTTFTPAAHSHVIGDLPATVFSTTHLPDWTEIGGKPSTFVPAVHVHAASEITSGLISVSRLGGGTPSSSTYLRGDGTWQLLNAAALGITSDAAAATPSLRTLGTGATQAAAGNHTHTAAAIGLGNVANVAQVDLTSAQTVGGVKAFSSSPVVPNATTGTQAVNKSQLDTALAALPTMGQELGYAEIVANVSKTGTTLFNNTTAGLVAGLSVTVTGTGRPVEIEAYVNNLSNSTTGNLSCIYLVDGAGTGLQYGYAMAGYTGGQGTTVIIKVRKVLTSGQSYTFKVGVSSVYAGTVTINANGLGPAYLAVTQR